MSAHLITPLELFHQRDDPALAVLDCRHLLGDPEHGPRAFASGHVPGAVHAHLDRDLSAPAGVATGRHPHPTPRAAAQRLGELGAGDGRRVVVYDHDSGSIAARAWWMLTWLGHDDVHLLDGGWAAWRAAGLPFATGPASPRPTQLTPRPRPELIAGRTEAATAARLLDARAPERFLGISEPVDRIAGHVPGALNAPHADLVRDGALRPRDELRDHFSALLDGAAPTQAVYMCGSGVTACLGLFALSYAGLGGARLYPGSWSEWIATGGAVATGL